MSTVLDDDRYHAELAEAGRRFASVVGSLDGDAPVPSCPDWSVRDLVGHLGGVHYWAAAVARGSGPKVDRPTVVGPLDEWYLQQLAVLQVAFAETDPSEETWTFVGSRTVRFWIRRQAHETAMHVYDAELAAGAEPTYAAALAADAVSEVFDVMAPRRHAKTPVPLTGELSLVATDTDDRWTVRPSDQPAVVDYQHGPAPDTACVVRAPAAILATGLWRRTPIEQWDVVGDPGLVRAFVDAPLVT